MNDNGDGTTRHADARMPQQHWHGWGSPVGLGLGLMSAGAFFVIIAYGLSVLASIG